MKELDLQSEPFPPTGGSVAEGIRKQLGRPRMDQLEVLVREAVQNSWDARSGDGPVTFGVRYWQATDRQVELMRQAVFRKRAPEIDYDSFLKPGELAFLAIYDRGTLGLGGPTRADFEPDQGVRTDFVDFLRTVGQSRDLEFGGGTYGYGKAAFYTASQLRSIVVHSRCRASAMVEDRLMVAALGPSFSAKSNGERRRYTGRHWWGREAWDGVVDPLVGTDAADAARELGLPSFTGDGRGTTILIPAPNLGGRTPQDAMDFLMRTLLRYFWPKQIDGPQGVGSMQFELFLNDAPIVVPRADEIPELKPFVQVFRGLVDDQEISAPLGAEVHEIECRRPFQSLGVLGLGRFPVVGARLIKEDAEGTDPLDGASHHTALLRAPNFVVAYLPGPPVPYEGVQYAGVFKARREVDAVFAESEPPTHDDWVPDGLEDPHHQTYVRTGLRRLKEKMRDFAAPAVGGSGEATAVPLGAFSDQLGGLVAELSGTGGGLEGTGGSGTSGGVSGGRKQRGGGGGGSRRSRARIAMADRGQVKLVNGEPALEVEFDLAVEGDAPAAIEANATVVLEGGVPETEPPAGAARPRVIVWTAPDGEVIGGEQCTVPPARSGRWKVAVAIPDDTMISVSVTERRGRPA